MGGGNKGRKQGKPLSGMSKNLAKGTLFAMGSSNISKVVANSQVSFGAEIRVPSPEIKGFYQPVEFLSLSSMK